MTIHNPSQFGSKKEADAWAALAIVNDRAFATTDKIASERAASGRDEPAPKDNAASGDDPSASRGHGYWTDEPQDDPDWKRHLHSKPDGSLDPSAFVNFRLFLTYHPEMKGRVRFNHFTGEIEIGAVSWRRDNGTRPLTDSDIVRAREFLQQKGMKPTKDEAHSALIEAASEKSYDPLTDYLAGLAWDGVPRIHRWLSDYMGCDDTALHQEFARRTLIGAVRRALEPGCKHDTLLVLEGPQGVGKSRALRAMVPDGKWFSDCLSLDAAPRELIETSAGKWLIEAAELGGIRKADVDALKATLSRQSDKARGAYQREPVEKQRRFLLIGTTNPAAGGYLIDPTGNRRFWPVAVGKIDLDAIDRDRNQLWAEAVQRCWDGEPNWLSAEFEALAAGAADERCEGNHLVDLLRDVLDDVSEITAAESLGLIGISVDKRNRQQILQAADALKSLGFHKGNKPKFGSAPWRRRV